ncbi:MAG: TfoX/Sxy family protein [Anaerovoracaceae bacterium]
MATNIDFVEYICEQIAGVGAVRNKKMFGEYMVYVNDKPILLVCDNTVFVKKLESVAEILADAEVGEPYKGAKEHYILDVDNRELCCQVVKILELITKFTKPRKKIVEKNAKNKEGEK